MFMDLSIKKNQSIKSCDKNMCTKTQGKKENWNNAVYKISFVIQIGIQIVV